MLSVNDKLQNLILGVQGFATLRGNWIAAQIQKLYRDAWLSCFSGNEANPGAFRGISNRVNTAIYLNNDAVFKTVWLRCWLGSQKALPKPLGMALSSLRKLREAEEPDPDEAKPRLPAPLPASMQRKPIRNPAISKLPKARGIVRYSIPENPPIEFEYAQSLYKPLKQREIDALNLKSEWKRFIEKNSHENEIIEKVNAGLIEGKHNRDISKDIIDLVEGDKVRASRIARTETHRVNTAAQEDSLRKGLGNSIKSWKYVATLDARTRPHHAARDGKVYKDAEPRPYLPDGPNCRCVYSPVTKSFAELGIPELEGLFTPAQRASIDGEVPANEVYSKWFNKQSPTTQRKIIGPMRFDALAKNGKVKWSEYVAMPNSPAKEKPIANIKGDRRAKGAIRKTSKK